MRILLTGAGGFLGTALGQRLTADGHAVVALGRRSVSGGGPTWNPVAGTLDPGAFAGVEAVVHLAGESIAGGPWTAARKHRIRESRIRGTTLLATTMARLDRPPAVLVSISAVGIYGNRFDEILTEASAPGDGFLAGVSTDWEASTRAASEAGIRVVIPRLGVVLHPAGGMLRQLLLPFRLGLGARLGSGQQWMSWVSLSDVLSVIQRALISADLAGPINTVSPSPVTNAEFTTTLARALHRPAFLRAPAPILRLALGQLANELLLSGQRCAPTRLLAVGFPFADPELAPALATMLQGSAKAPARGRARD